MSRSKPPKAPPPVAVRAAAATLERLEAAEYDTGELLWAVNHHAGEPDRGRLARTFVQAFLERSLAAPGNLERPAQFVTLMVLMFGKPICLSALDAHLGGEDEVAAMATVLADLAGAEFKSWPAGTLVPQVVSDRVLEQLPEGEAGYYQILVQLLMTPRNMRTAVTGAILAAAAQEPALSELVTFLLLSPLDASSHQMLEAWLEDHGGEAGKWALARLSGKPAPSASPFKHLSFDWPLNAAYATFPDGLGSQSLLLVRSRGGKGGHLAALRVVISDQRGVAETEAQPELSLDEHEQVLAQIEAATALVPVPLAYFQARLNAGVADANERGLPLPFLLRVHWNLVTSLPAEPALELAPLVAAWNKPAQLAKTGALADEDFFMSWFEDAPEAGPLQPFFEASAALFNPPTGAPEAGPDDIEMLPELTPEAREALDNLVTAWLPRFFDAESRARWHGRLVQVAYLYHLQNATKLRDLAATAAAAIAPDSGVALASQPFAHAVLHQSAYAHATPVDEELMASLLDALGPPGA